MPDFKGKVGSQFSKAGSPDTLSFVLDRIRSLPHGDRIFQCIQCGTCGGACPVSFAMDKTPRQVINLVRAGRIEEALQTESIWICASCYSCMAQCPAGISITDIMYTLKVASTELGISHRDAIGPIFARSFANQLESKGRITEVPLFLRLALHKPRLLGTNGPGIYLKLLRGGRVKLRSRGVKGMDQLKKMEAWVAVAHSYLRDKGAK